MNTNHKNNLPILNSKKRGLRTGFTTGACAAAAARAATRALFFKQKVEKIEITLPNHQKQTFVVCECCILEEDAKTPLTLRSKCAVIKDAGDDPDCTHLAKICAEVCYDFTPEDKSQLNSIRVIGGEGVARVTKAGLGLAVDTWAINPVPKKNIIEMVTQERDLYKQANTNKDMQSWPLLVIISVPEGRQMAKKTINVRLGLVGGISILGTTGIVRPYSTSAFKFSILQAIDVASQTPPKKLIIDTLVFTTGGRSEQYALNIIPSLPEVVFIQVGDFIGTAVSYTSKKKPTIHEVIIVGMIGKLSKMAQGAMQTHQAGSKVDVAQLAQWATSLGADISLVSAIHNANTAREVLELSNKAGLVQLPSNICERVCQQIIKYLQRKSAYRSSLAITCLMTDFSGTEIGQATTLLSSD